MKIFLRSAWLRVLMATALGAFIGVIAPDVAVALRPLGDAFIAAIKMLIGPVVFCTVVLGIGGAGHMSKAGRIALKALVYFEVISTLALALGLMVVNVLGPGRGFHVNPATLDASAAAEFSEKAQHLSVSGYLLRLLPTTLFSAFGESGDLLQVLVVAILFGCALHSVGEKGRPVTTFLQSASSVLFKMVDLVMWFAPLGAGGAMAFTIGKYGLESLRPLLTLMFSFYLCCVLFVVFVLGSIAWVSGFSLRRFVWYIRAELMTVLGTSSSESVLVPMMEKLERLGCSKSLVGLVIPAGYSFNLDGTNIYLTMAAMFVAQALDIQLSLGQQLTLLLVAVLSSKGASGVTGAGFITLAATLIVVPSVPVAGLTLILGVDRFMSEARALTNTVGNGVATLAIARWEGELDGAKLAQELGS